ncbi:hypothetical protein GGF31_001773 [Allomyces arbusculus]|nr:hypothetical protein GGF31_001773 [Allomyces arbusculus]
MAATSIKDPRQEFQALLKDLQDAALQVKTAVEPLTDKIKPSAKGLSFLEVKNHCMMTYLTGLCHVAHTKLAGQAPTASPALDSLLDLRVIMEKIKPMETKLKYRIDKLLKATESTSASSDALSFKPNVANFDDDDDENEGADASASDADEEDAKGGTTSRTGVYRPPKLAPVHYDDGRKADRAAQRALRSAASARLARDLEDEFGDAPEVRGSDVVRSDSAAAESIHKHFADRQAYEEEHMLRVNWTRADKKKRSQLERVGLTNELLNLNEDFGGAVDDDAADFEDVLSYVDKRGKKKRGRHADDEDDVDLVSRSTKRGPSSDFAQRKTAAKRSLHRTVGRENKRRKSAGRQ